MSSDPSCFESSPASTVDECDALLRVLLRMHPSGDARWKAIQIGFDRHSTLNKSTQWLKNRAKKLAAEDAEKASRAPAEISGNVPQPTHENQISKKMQQSQQPRNSQCNGELNQGYPDMITDMLNTSLDMQLCKPTSRTGMMNPMMAAMGAAGILGDGSIENTFHTACELGRTPDVKRLQEAGGIDVNWRYKDGSTPLLIATQRQNVSVVQLLVLMPNVDLECHWVSNGGDTPLSIAAEFGNFDMVETLLSSRASVLARNPLGATPLEKAAGKGHARIAKRLLQQCAPVNVKSHKGGTPLISAAENGHTKLVQLLYAAKSDLNVSADGFTALSAAAMYGHTDIVKLLLSWGHTVDDDDGFSMTPLFAAAANQHSQAAVLLIKANADPRRINTEHDMSSLEVCTVNDNQSLLTSLIRAMRPEEQTAFMRNRGSSLEGLRRQLPPAPAHEAAAEELVVRGRFMAAQLMITRLPSPLSAEMLMLQARTHIAQLMSGPAVEAAKAAVRAFDARDADDLEAQRIAMQVLVEAYLIGHKVAAAHVAVAEWSVQRDGRADMGWSLQQMCFQRSPFIWSHHEGLEVIVHEGGFGMRTRLPIRAHDAVLCECAAVEWSGKQVREVKWVVRYLQGKEKGSSCVANDHLVSYSDIMDGLHPRGPEAVREVIGTLPDAVQRLLRCDGHDTPRSQHVSKATQALLRANCNGHDDGVHLSEAFVNHSCKPNCELRGRFHAQLYATRDIEAGEELCISYMRLSNLLHSQAARSDIFKHSWGSVCNCARCAQEAGESADDGFQSELSGIQQQLMSLKVDALKPEVEKLLQGKLVGINVPWKQHVVDMVLEDVLTHCLPSLSDISPRQEDLVYFIEALIRAHSNQMALLGESAHLESLVKTLGKFEQVYTKLFGPLPTAVSELLHEANRVHRLCSGSK